MTLGLDDDKPQRSLINNGTLSVTASSLSFSSSNMKDFTTVHDCIAGERI